MASLRADTQVWNAEPVASGNTSKIVYVGACDVAVYIDPVNAGTFTIQVAPTTGPVAGLNALSSTAENQDGGLVWHDYSGQANINVAAGEPTAFDLSPFGPQYVRVKRTDSNGGNVSAWISAFGPN